MPRARRSIAPGSRGNVGPLWIFYRIVFLQLIFYTCSAALIIFTALVSGKPPSFELVFDWRTLRGDVTAGWMYGLVWMLTSLICVIFLLLLIARSKLVPDFALTIHFLHLLVTTLYTRSLPSYGFWWALQIASATLMTSLGVWSCRYRELQPIQIGTGRKPSTISHPTARKLGMNGQDSSRLREEVTPLTAADPESYEMA